MLMILMTISMDMVRVALCHSVAAKLPVGLVSDFDDSYGPVLRPIRVIVSPFRWHDDRVSNPMTTMMLTTEASLCRYCP